MKASPGNSLRAVLTGDVVGSSLLEPGFRSELPGVLKRCGAALRKTFGAQVPYDLAVFRGDSWQVLLSDPRLALRAALFLRTGVIMASPAGQRLDTRIAIAVETIDFVSKGQVSEGDGPAYRASGSALDTLAEPRRLALVTPQPIPGGTVALALLDALAEDWTPAQARALHGKLRGQTQEEISDQWPEGISQQGVAKHQARAHTAAVMDALEYFEYNLQTL